MTVCPCKGSSAYSAASRTDVVEYGYTSAAAAAAPGGALFSDPMVGRSLW